MRKWQGIILIALSLVGIVAAGQAGAAYGQRDKLAPPIMLEAAVSETHYQWL